MYENHSRRSLDDVRIEILRVFEKENVISNAMYATRITFPKIKILIDDLLKNGLIESRKPKNNRRITAIYILSEKGKQTIELWRKFKDSLA